MSLIDKERPIVTPALACEGEDGNDKEEEAL